MTYRRRASATDNTAVIERLERERDELADSNQCLLDRNADLEAHCGRLREDMYEMADVLHGEFGVNEPVEDFLPESYHETPAQSLANVRAEAVEEYAKHLRRHGQLLSPVVACDYAKAIRRGER